MKAGWELKTLESLATFRSGLWTGKKGPFTTAKVIRNTNIRPHGQLSLDDVAEIEVETRQLETRLLRPGDIILERSGGGPKQAVGRAVYFDLDEDDFSFSNFTSIIRVQSPTVVSYRFLHLVLNWWYETGVTEKIQSNSTGIRNLDFNAYKALQVPLPSLEEQQRIVAVLDEAFECLTRARAHAEANLQNARELFENTLDLAFLDAAQSSGVCHLADAFQTTTGSTPPKNDSALYGHALAFVKPPELLGLEIGRTADGLSEQGRKVARVAPTGSVLVSCIGILGKVGLARCEVAFNQQINAILPNASAAIPEFMYFQALSSWFRHQLEGRAGGTTVPIVNKSRFNSIQVVLPPLDEQERLAGIFQEVRTQTTYLLAAYRAKLQSLDALRQSLLQKAFAGELT